VSYGSDFGVFREELEYNNNNIIIIQFNSIYLCAKLNSHRPITKLAQVVQRRRGRGRRRRSKELES
jgi:hypothetical protein